MQDSPEPLERFDLSQLKKARTRLAKHRARGDRRHPAQQRPDLVGVLQVFDGFLGKVNDFPAAITRAASSWLATHRQKP